MESYMIWQLSMLVGFLLAVMVMLLIAAAIALNWFLAKGVVRDMEKMLTQCDDCGEVTSDERES